ncbi:MAG: hypothetical protein WAM78_12605 [Candidatus Sulfotelmatobacter sp.]
MQVLSDPPSSLASTVGPQRPSLPSQTRLLDRKYTIDDEFPADLPVGYDWFLQPASRQGFQRAVGALSATAALLLLGFVLWRVHHFLTLMLALGIILAIVAIAAAWKVGYSILVRVTSRPTVSNLRRPTFHLKN